MKLRTKTILFTAVMAMFFSLPACGGGDSDKDKKKEDKLDICECQRQSLNPKNDMDSDFMKKCEKAFKSMSLGDLQKAMEDCARAIDM